MIVLSAIGRFFKKIWDWIKNTAWIQPLLIVGIIFGVIFSIPSIVKAVKKGKSEKATYNTYYHNFKYSLEGEGESKADKFSTNLADIMTAHSEDELKKATDSFKENYPDLGEKFFVAFVAKDCDKCEDAKDGFATFEKKLDSYKTDYKDDFKDNENYGLVTIFTDDENNDTTETKTAFVSYLERHQDLFEEAGSVAYETPYYHNEKLNDDDLEALETADPDNFLTPTIFLVELGQTATANEQPQAGITEIMFGVDGSDKNAKAKTLLNCWNHTGEFSYNQK